jgi:receptor expression-enhancing protein 1/2/3/4
MFMSMLSHIICAWFAFLIPSYSTFKALAQRPLSEAALERWAMYWSVVGAFVAFEYIGEWFISWFPFYWEVKTLFLLFLALPQTQGSTYIYRNHLQPFFVKNEADLDAGISSVQSNAIAFVQAHLSNLWDLISRQINKSQAAATNAQGANGGAPALAANGASGFNLQNAMGLFRSYAPMFMGGVQTNQKKDEAATPARPSFGATTARVSSGLIPESRVPLPQTPNNTSTVTPPFPEPQHF